MNKHPHVYKTAAGSGVLHFVCLTILFCSFAVTVKAEWKEPKLPSPYYAPPATITGKVTDSKNTPMEGVNVTIKGTKRGAITNAAGTFSIANVPENATLVFSYTGFADKEVAIKGTAPLTVSLTETVTGLNDVVVVGYGTSTKKDLTGAISQVKATQLENENPRSVQDLLRGNAPGLDVGFDGSTKGSNASLQIRGKGSIKAGTSPLIVLDGVIYPGGLEDINPNDIATVDILKDASAAAVFGSRGSNGIILITTKKGKVGKPLITFNTNVALNKVQRQPHLLDGQEYVQFRSDAEWAIKGYDSTSAVGVKYKFTDPSRLPSSITLAQWLKFDNSTADPVTTWLTRLEMKPIEIANYLADKSLDWQRLIYNQNAMQQDHTVSISQRTDNSNYYFSLGYLENNGITVGDKYKTLRARFSFESKLTEYLTVGANVQFAERDESTVSVSLGDVIQTSPWGSMFIDGSTTVLRISPNDDPGNNTNPFMNQRYTDRLYRYDNIFVNLSARGKLPFGFSYEVHFAPTYNTLREYNHVKASHPVQFAKNGIVDRRNQTTYNWTNDNILRWNGKYGKHSIEATFLVNAEKNQNWDTRIHAENFSPNDNLSFDAIQSATVPLTGSSSDTYNTRSALMGRINYNYNQRYFLTVTERQDGYSGFGDSTSKKANFVSASLAWALSEERFMQHTSSWLDYAKLRVSYGENGNSSIDNLLALATLGSGSYVYVTPGGVANNVISVFSSNLANPNLRWERKAATNFGLDYSILKGRVSGSIDYYISHTKDLLVDRTLPSVTGFGSIIANLGGIQNNGFEVSINTQNIKRANFEWRSTISFWANSNKIEHLYGATPDFDATGKQIGTSEKSDSTNNWYLGKNFNTVYNYKVIGVWQLSEATEAAKYGYKPGDMKLEDVNGDGKYTTADRQFLGTTTPKFSWNLRNEFHYKDFDFSFVLYSRIGQIRENNEYKNNDHFYNRSNFYQRPYWTPTNPINDYAAINSNVGGAVSWTYYRSASFVRLSNVSLAYTVPANTSRKWGFQSIKAYINVVNAAVFTGWKYFDPEYRGPNNDTNTYPVPVSYNFGLNVTL